MRPLALLLLLLPAPAAIPAEPIRPGPPSAANSVPNEPGHTEKPAATSVSEQPTADPFPLRPVDPERPTAEPLPLQPVDPEKPAAEPLPLQPVDPEKPAAARLPIRPGHPEWPAANPLPIRPGHPEKPAAEPLPLQPVRPEQPAAEPLPLQPVDPEPPAAEPLPIRPGHPEWPAAWIAYRTVVSLEADFVDLKNHGVGLVSMKAADSAQARRLLAAARRAGMKYHIGIPEITENAALVRTLGIDPVDALMIGGVYQGKAIDRHLFRFTAAPQRIVVEPPLFRAGCPWPGIAAPARAEIVVPLRKFDGAPHLRVVPATVEPAGSGYWLSFDLTGLDSALLDQVGVAVYWPYHGYPSDGAFGTGMVSALAPSTREAARRAVQESLNIWTEANGGAFPLDVVLAAWFGSECFYLTAEMSLDSVDVSFPLWDYSAPAIEAFRKRAPGLEYPRTWGFPEIYGADAYAEWMYLLHESCASLVGVVKDEIAKLAPGLLLFRNTTARGVFSPANDHDGTGPELLARNLDILNLDPFPMIASGYTNTIPREMSYYAGLARRYNRILVPSMQGQSYFAGKAFSYMSPSTVKQMMADQWMHAPDAVQWFNYGDTFPAGNRESWERAGEFHKLFAAMPPPKPRPQLAVLRSYRARALSSLSDRAILNPADWLLQQWLYVWSAVEGRPYDVFELPPRLSDSERAALKRQLKKYRHVVSTEPWPGALLIGEDSVGKTIAPAERVEIQTYYHRKMLGWLRK